MKRVFNFSPGPAMLPGPVLLRAQVRAARLAPAPLGMSVMQVSHRGTDFIEYAAQVGARFARAARMCRPVTRCCSYRAAPHCSSQPVPLNIASGRAPLPTTSSPATGARRRSRRRERYVTVNVAADQQGNELLLRCRIPSHVEGLEQRRVPALHAERDGVRRRVPQRARGIGRAARRRHVVDAAIASRSTSASSASSMPVRRRTSPRRPCDRHRARRSARPSRRGAPASCDFKTMAENDSMWNTPSTLSWDLAGLVFQWLKEQGGLTAMGKVNERKAAEAL